MIYTLPNHVLAFSVEIGRFTATPVLEILDAHTVAKLAKRKEEKEILYLRCILRISSKEMEEERNRACKKAEDIAMG